MSDALLTWLDKRERDNEGYPCDIDDLVDALRAVLAACDWADTTPDGDCTVGTDRLRHVIADALGVQP